jgi:site-specific recombinase XerD
MVYDKLLSQVADSPRQPALLGHFLLAKKVEDRSLRTLEWYQEALDGFGRFCRQERIDPDPANITPLNVRMWLAHIQETGVSKSTVNGRFRALRAFFNWCVAEGIIDRSPMSNIRTPSVGSILIPVFSPMHVKALLHLCPPNTWWGARDRAIILTLLHTGIRLSELTGLGLGDVNFTLDCIKVLGKGDKERTIYLAPEAQQAILRYIRHRSDSLPYLWLSCGGAQLTSNAVQQLIRDLGQRAGIKGVRCSAHTFRHTFAVNFLKAGGSLRHLQEIMGHTTMKPLEVYLRTVSADDAMHFHRQVKPFKGWQL